MFIEVPVIVTARTCNDLNKAGYTATPVACGWAGAKIEVTHHLGRSSEAKNRKNPKKDGQTNGRTDKARCRVA